MLFLHPIRQGNFTDSFMRDEVAQEFTQVLSVLMASCFRDVFNISIARGMFKESTSIRCSGNLSTIHFAIVSFKVEGKAHATRF